ncbi:type VI secretion system lipoprotein TssJ [Pseudomaricurvus sp.]|uniref:type VI secretion system lipoprotein TssJ n=1 Tax=Pseudomaricurvus sp. TaxID=2004510 RepID=UPI003F6AA210
MSTNGITKLFIIGFIIISLAGCQATRRGLNFDTTAAINLSVDSNVNPDMDDRSSPIVIRVFKLADARQFQREDFLNLYENAPARLGNDLIDTVVLKELVPGEQRVESIPLTPDVRYLGFLAEYMQYEKANSVIVVPIKEHSKNSININARYLSLIDLDNPESVRNSRLSQRDQYNSQPRSGQRNDYPSYRDTQEAVKKVQDEKEFWERATSN